MLHREFTDLDLDFYAIVASNWTLEEVDAWSDYAHRVETGLVTLKF